jgi:hypothetical protein
MKVATISVVMSSAAQPKEEEDFSWDDAEAETEPDVQEATPRVNPTTTFTPVKTTEAIADVAVQAPTSTTDAAAVSPVVESVSPSRRQSEESYDIVSETSGGDGTRNKGTPETPVARAKQEDTDGEDSDWE